MFVRTLAAASLAAVLLAAPAAAAPSAADRGLSFTLPPGWSAEPPQDGEPTRISGPQGSGVQCIFLLAPAPRNKTQAEIDADIVAGKADGVLKGSVDRPVGEFTREVVDLDGRKALRGEGLSEAVNGRATVRILYMPTPTHTFQGLCAGPEATFGRTPGLDALFGSVKVK